MHACKHVVFGCSAQTVAAFCLLCLRSHTQTTKTDTVDSERTLTSILSVFRGAVGRSPTSSPPPYVWLPLPAIVTRSLPLFFFFLSKAASLQHRCETTKPPICFSEPLSHVSKAVLKWNQEHPLKKVKIETSSNSPEEASRSPVSEKQRAPSS